MNPRSHPKTSQQGGVIPIFHSPLRQGGALQLARLPFLKTQTIPNGGDADPSRGSYPGNKAFRKICKHLSSSNYHGHHRSRSNAS